ncbi:apolipoprotein N-acyltransferase [Lichenicoccus roseus]|uniref:Apolipoprotein N-acyltransferase n=1 Tax=Lichenicoccus roseus TaxID=2683649 RepID=A0A5R9J3Z8_9PROT|nr:apolipoprotein N-acyltransferase [Lichenicoccus roseus]TLU72355.1 apolipoprotein N-acyltransferase [Lichenicoccus roseus]
MFNLLLGAASALALPPVGLTGILWLTLPLLLARLGARPVRGRAAYGALLDGFLFGFGYYCAGLYWITNAILTRVDQFWWAVPLATPLCAVPLAVVLALPCALAMLAPSGWRRVAAFAGLWTLSDLAREFLFTGFPWNPLGSSWEWPGRAGDIMIQPAAWVGVPGLTLLTLLAALLPTLGRRGIAGSLVLLALWAGAGTLRLGTIRPVGAPGPVVLLVQGNIPESEKLDHDTAVQTFRKYLALTAGGAAQAGARARSSGRAMVFTWPESAFPGLLDEDAQARAVIMAQAPGASAGLIGSVRFGADERPRNSMVALRPDGGIAALYDKAHLVPFGEYQPAGLPFQVVPGGGFAAGPGPRTLRLPGLAPFGTLICYEVIFPGRVVQPGDRPGWLLNITNDAWYGDSAGPHQHLQSARMRAVEEGLPLARAANTGISAAFDGFGRRLGELGWGRSGSLDVALPPPLPPTLFARHGLWVPLLMALLCILGLKLPGRTRRITRSAGDPTALSSQV